MRLSDCFYTMNMPDAVGSVPVVQHPTAAQPGAPLDTEESGQDPAKIKA